MKQRLSGWLVATSVIILLLVVASPQTEAYSFYDTIKCFMCTTVAAKLEVKAKVVCDVNKTNSTRWTVHDLHKLCNQALIDDINRNFYDVGLPARFKPPYCYSLFSNKTKDLIQNIANCGDQHDMVCKFYCLIEEQGKTGNNAPSFLCSDFCDSTNPLKTEEQQSDSTTFPGIDAAKLAEIRSLASKDAEAEKNKPAPLDPNSLDFQPRTDTYPWPWDSDAEVPIAEKASVGLNLRDRGDMENSLENLGKCKSTDDWWDCLWPIFLQKEYQGVQPQDEKLGFARKQLLKKIEEALEP